MASANHEQDSYVFNRGHKSTVRLNYQHFWMKQLCGYLIHPTIPTQSPNIRIADIGTGTGIWPLELSHELPGTARIDGFDISPAQYPHRNWLPANVILHVHNAFAPFPQEYVGVYDVVHVRFFLLP
ncbi:hypothetical protein N7G274_008776 [Stereocaulon virgatum]|uniref:Methyltransferase domain-containing protein n=1 Tax=Stereocaulon virgatum TaxID=373712 RepID=A0ABR3ZXP2_9LECA